MYLYLSIPGSFVVYLSIAQFINSLLMVFLSNLEVELVDY